MDTNEPQLHRTDDHDTSIEAADLIADKLDGLRALVWDIYQRYPAGLTDSELRTIALATCPDNLGVDPETWRKRRSDLKTMGYIAPTEARRLNPKGRSETVWKMVSNPQLPSEADLIAKATAGRLVPQDEVAKLIAAEREALINVLRKTNAIVAEAASTGFNPTSGDWAERLFANQQDITAAIGARGET
jgi:hypothetical protein